MKFAKMRSVDGLGSVKEHGLSEDYKTQLGFLFYLKFWFAYWFSFPYFICLT